MSSSLVEKIDRTTWTAQKMWFASLAGPLAALLLYLPTLGGTFLSDDFLVNTMLTHGAEPTVRWSEILADFGRSWAGLTDAHLYRPLVSVSWALTYALGGMDPFLFHATNITVHALTAFACAVLCALCSPRPNLAAVLGGMMFAVHPVAAEPACWIASRTAGLQVLFATGAMACFAGYLRFEGRGRLALTAAFFVLSLLCKESAVLVPVSLFAIHLIIRGWPREVREFGVHGIMLGILAAYFLLRLLVLGKLIGGAGAGMEAIHGDAIQNLVDKFAILLLPVGNGLPGVWGFPFGAAAMLGLAALVIPGAGNSSTRSMTVLGGLWVALYFAPTYRLTVHPETLGGSRMVYGATVVLAVYVTAIATRAASKVQMRVGIALLIGGLSCLGVARMNQYRQAFDHMGFLQTSLADQARKATVESPLAIVTIAPPPLGIPFLNCNALYPLAEIPVAETDTPAVSLGFIFQPVPLSEDLIFDVGPMRALRGQGAWLLNWNPGSESPHFLADRAPPGRPSLPMPEFSRPPDLTTTKPGWFLADRRFDPYLVEALEIETSGPCTGGRVEWLYSPTAEPALQNVREYLDVVPPPQFEKAAKFATFSRGTRDGDRTTYHVDISHHLSVLAIGFMGRVAGFRVVLDSADARPIAVRAHARVEELDLVALLRDTELDLSDTATKLRAPPMPEGTDSMSLYLIGPDTTIAVRDIQPGPITLTPELREAIRIILRSARQKRYYYYFEATGLRPHRSPIDWFRFKPK